MDSIKITDSINVTIKTEKYKMLIPWALLLISLLANGYFLLHYTFGQNIAESPQQQIADTINAVGKLIVLPTDETPTIATVTNLDQIKNQPFFADAKIGDKVLIYTKAQKAILYDPIANKIVELAPFNSGVNPAASQ